MRRARQQVQLQRENRPKQAFTRGSDAASKALVVLKTPRRINVNAASRKLMLASCAPCWHT